jgi:hypothetical protein
MRALGSDGIRIDRIVKLAALCAATVISFALAPVLHAQASTPGEATSRELVNSARSAAGVGSLADDGRLDAIARAQAARMAERDGIYHNPNLKADADATGVNWQWIGENVGVGPDIQAIHDGFMASPGHHENIVYRDYNVIGVGVAVGKDGSIFVAQVFAGVAPAQSAPASQVAATTQTPTAPPSSAPAPSHVEPKAAPTHTPLQPAATRPEVPPSTPNALVGGVVNPEIVGS